MILHTNKTKSVNMGSLLFRCSVIILLQIIGSPLLQIPRSFCNCFQTTTSRSANKSRLQPANNKARSPYFSSFQNYQDCCEYDGELSTTKLSSSTTTTTAEYVEYTVTLHYENNSCDILVRCNETLLAAIERNQLSLEQLGLPNYPSDCRRGNCLTCSGTHASASSRLSSGTSVVCDGDGLSPHISQTIQDKGYILTCSTRVVGEGLQLNLDENHNVWKDVYQDRFDDEPNIKKLAWAAMAKTKRLSDERNVSRWQKRQKI